VCSLGGKAPEEVIKPINDLGLRRVFGKLTVA
jgi:hypothetical protein